MLSVIDDQPSLVHVDFCSEAKSKLTDPFFAEAGTKLAGLP